MKLRVEGGHRLRLVAHAGPLGVRSSEHSCNSRDLSQLNSETVTEGSVKWNCSRSLVRSCKAVSDESWQVKLLNDPPDQEVRLERTSS